MKHNSKTSFKQKWKPGPNGQQKGKQRQTPNKRNKLHIKFDVEDRRKYLTGFQKRKQERREKALKVNKENLKAEMKQIKKEREQLLKKIMNQGQELAFGLKDCDKDDSEDKDNDKEVVLSSCGTAQVEIRGLDLTLSKHHIGTNQMEFKKKVNHLIKEKEANLGSDNTGEEEEEEEDVSPEKLDSLGIHTKQDLYRSLQKSTFNIMKKSSMMKQKQARDAKKQRKGQMRVKNKKQKMLKKKMKHRRSKPMQEG